MATRKGDSFVTDAPSNPEPAPVIPADLATGFIQVTLGYSGEPTRDRFIAPGMYSVNDPQVSEVIDILLTGGFAVKI